MIPNKIMYVSLYCLKVLNLMLLRLVIIYVQIKGTLFMITFYD